MIARLLPAAVTAVEAFDDSVEAPLFPQEEDYVARAVPKRRTEFATARRCAREALAALDFPAAPLLCGPKREPLWPAGIVGSITHCAGYRAAAVARASDILSLGIDAEPHEPLPDGILESIALMREQEHVDRLGQADPAIRWDRLLFSAKESIYKTWYPLAKKWLDFKEAEIEFDPARAAFTAKVHIAGPLSRLTGRYAVDRDLIVTAISVAA